MSSVEESKSTKPVQQQQNTNSQGTAPKTRLGIIHGENIKEKQVNCILVT
jgi:hypothetical protein